MGTAIPSEHDPAVFTLAVQHPLTRDWAYDEARPRRLARSHEFDVRLATDHDLAAERAGQLDVGQPSDAFLNRWLTVSDTLEGMLSIRLAGLDREKPFVDATVLSRAFTADDLPALARVAQHTYGAFRPGYLRLWSAAPTDAFAGTDRDKRFLAAPLRDLAGVGEVPRELAVARTRDLSRYPDALAAYAAVDFAHPGHPDQAATWAPHWTTGRISALMPTWCRRSSLSPSVGVAATAPTSRRCSPCTARSCQDPAWHDPRRQPWGLRAASRSGRQDIGGWLQLPLDEMP